MQRIAKLSPCGLSLLIVLASGSAELFAQETDPATHSSGLLSAIVWVVVWMVVFAAIGAGIYAWFGKRRSKFTGSLRHAFRDNIPSGVPSIPLGSVTTPRRVAARLEPQQEQTTSLDIQRDTPEALSLRELKQAASLRSSDEIYEYYDEISAIVKRYVEQKYHIKTLDATTGEILGSLPHDLTDPALDHVGEILRTCDMIHLSRHRPSQSDLDNIYRTTEEFFESQIKQPESEDESEDDLAELTKHYRRMV